MLKKIFLLCFILFISINFGCTKKEEPLLKNDVVVAYESNFDEEVLNVKDKYVLVVFHETKSHWSKSQLDALEIFKNDREIGNKIKIVRVNLEEEPNLYDRFKMETMLTHILFYNGEIIYRNTGYIDSPHMNQYLKPYVKLNN